MKNILVLGAGGFIGSHLVSKLKESSNYVIGIDLEYPKFESSAADEFIIGDLRDQQFCKEIFTKSIDEVYQLAADMGGAQYIFTGDNDYNIMSNSCAINLNVTQNIIKNYIKKVFYSSSACIYPRYNQLDPANPKCSESDAYPADPDSEYGWEKLFGEHLYLSLAKNYHVDVKVARYHNIFGPKSVWSGGREKAPAAICRKVIQADDGGQIDIWGNGLQTRSFLYIDDCIEATLKLMSSQFAGPVNIGSEEMVTINQLANLVINISDKKLSINNINGPIGVAGRTSDNTLIKEKLGWNYSYSLEKGIRELYNWMLAQ